MFLLFFWSFFEDLFGSLQFCNVRNPPVCYRQALPSRQLANRYIRLSKTAYRYYHHQSNIFNIKCPENIYLYYVTIEQTIYPLRFLSSLFILLFIWRELLFVWLKLIYCSHFWQSLPETHKTHEEKAAVISSWIQL